MSDITAVTEGYIFNESPIYLNVPNWKSGITNVLYITGLSGSGKGYIAKQYANERDDVIIIELDKFENYQWYYKEKDKNINVAKGDEIIYKYMKDRFKNLDIDIFANDVNKYRKELKLFIDYLLGYMHDNKYYKFIIEGIQIFCDDAFDYLSNKDSIIVIRTSAVKSMRKVMNRPHNTIRNKLHTFIDAQKKLKDFVKRINASTDNAALESANDTSEVNFKTPEDLLNWMRRNIKYKNHTNLLSIAQLLSLRRGSCHDQSYFAHSLISSMGFRGGIYFIIESNIDGQGGMTHSFAWYKKGDKYYWFENAWSTYNGIHEFNSISDIYNEIRTMHKNGKWGNNKSFPTIEIRPMKYSVGDTLQQIVAKTFS